MKFSADNFQNRPPDTSGNQIIKDFYAGWIAEHPEKKMRNDDLQDYILVKYLSITETAEKAARQYGSTLAVM